MPQCYDPRCPHCNPPKPEAPAKKEPQSTQEIADAAVCLVRQLGDPEMIVWANEQGAKATLDALDRIAAAITEARQHVHDEFPELKED